jgi:hypothetical protein
MAESTMFTGEWSVQIIRGGKLGAGHVDGELCKSSAALFRYS